MKRLFLPFMIAGAIAPTIISCTKEGNPQEQEPELAPGMEKVMLGVGSENAKTAVDGTTVTWMSGDEIKLFDDEHQESTGTATQSGQSTTFESTVYAGKNVWYAFYPSSVAGHDDDGFYMTIPAEQDGSFATSNFSAGVLHRNSDSRMTNQTGFIKLAVSGDNYSKIVISAVGNEYICGRLNVMFDGDVVSTNNDSIDGSVITLKKAVGNLDATTYYIAVAPGVTLSNGLLVKYYEGDNVTKAYYIEKNLTPAKNMFTSVGTLENRCGKFYVSVDGAGAKSGGNWDNAMGKAEFLALVTRISDNANPKSAARAAMLKDATFYFEGGVYDFGSEVSLGFNNDVKSYINFTFEGGYYNGSKDVQNHPTIISGNNEHCIFILSRYTDLAIIDCNIENSYGNGGGKAAIRLESKYSKIQLTRCNFNNNKNNYTAGGINVGYGTATLTNCVFSGNTASAGAAINIDNGADDHIDQTGAVSISGCTFDGNTASSGYGGAMRIKSGGPVSVTGCDFVNCKANETNGLGGAIYCAADENNCSFSNCKFSGCVSYRGGAFYSESTYTAESMNFDNCEFTQCYAPDEGAAVELISTKAVTYELNNCNFHDNTSPWGALASRNTETTITININGGEFKNNEGRDNDGWQNGAALFPVENSLLYVSGVKFEGNIANNGPAIDLRDKTTVVHCDNCQFINNEAKNNGGVFYESGDYTKLYCNNSVFDGNLAGQEGAVYSCGDKSSETAYFNACVFRMNHWGKAYGCLFDFDKDKTNKFAFNNCTFIRNYINSDVSCSEYQSTWFNLNNIKEGGYVVFSNSTFWGRPYQGLTEKEADNSTTRSGFIRVSNSNTLTLKLVNSIVCNSSSSGNGFTINGSPTISAKYCLLSPNKNQNESATWNPDNGSIHTVLARGTFFDGYQKYENLATADYVTIKELKGAAAGFAKQSTAEINSAINDASSDFYSWLSEIGALGKDCRGYTRDTEANWPGAYDNDATNN